MNRLSVQGKLALLGLVALMPVVVLAYMLLDRIQGDLAFSHKETLTVPLALPAFATLAIFSFLFAWNDFLWPLLVTNSDELRTIQIGLAAFQGRYNTSWNYLMAGTVMATLPAMAVFMAFQRLLVRGIAMTGLKD